MVHEQGARRRTRLARLVELFGDFLSGIWIRRSGLFEVHDWINIEGGARGEVLHVGLCSTRVLTSDGTEISLPNGLIQRRMVANESRGRCRSRRLGVTFIVAYGNDVDEVRELVLRACRGVAHVLDGPEAVAPRLGLRGLGSGGLEFELSIWVSAPGARDRVWSEIRRRIHADLTRAGIAVVLADRVGPVHAR